MNNRLLEMGVLAIAIALPSAVTGARQQPGAPSVPQKLGKSAETSRPYAPPRTPWGDPNLQGNYTNKYEQSTPFERPREFEGRRLEDVSGAELAGILKTRHQQVLDRAPGVGPLQFRDSLDVTRGSRAWLVVDPPDGRIPRLTPLAQRRITPSGTLNPVNGLPVAGSSFGDGPFNGPEDLSLFDRCITRGLPGSMMPFIHGNSYQIVQAPGVVSIRYELIHETRVIPLDGHPHVGKGIRLEMGDARGRWEGNTLVVETTNFSDRSVYRNADPDSLRLIERFTRTAADRVEWSVTVDDTATWTQPWTFAMPLTMNDREPVLEYACHEGNYGLRNILSAARAEERNHER
jgi:hypothetical protein